MREACERIVHLGTLEDSKAITDLLERAAAEMHAEGWDFVASAADALVENVTLFFEREVEE